MRKGLLLSNSVILALLFFAVDGSAQQAPETRVGCLMNGETAGTFILVDEITGRRVVVTGTDLGRFTGSGGSRVTVTGTATTQQGGTETFQITTVEQTRDLCAPTPYSPENQRFELRRARFGVRAGIGLDPTLVSVGAQTQLGPLFREIWFRPTVEYAFGEVTSVFSINGDVAFYLPFAGIGRDPRNRWNVYVGGGPAFTLLRRDFSGYPNQPIDIGDDWDSQVGLNFIFGAVQTGGLFAELRAAAYNEPTVRIYLGYVFR